MKTIPLSKGFVALVDDEDFEFLSQWKWCASLSARGFPYAMRVQIVNGKRHRISMHRVLFPTPRGLQVDHIDHNGLNNQKRNLRAATQKQNASNCRMRSNNTSGFRGVVWNRKNQKWEACLGHNHHRIYLGIFKDRRDAAKAHDEAALKLKGEFAATNKSYGLL